MTKATNNLLTPFVIICSLIGLFGSLIDVSHGALTYRLDKRVLPESYDIKIKPYFQAIDGDKRYTFDGEVNITLFAVQANISVITLHKDFIDILQVKLYDYNTKNLLKNIPHQDLSYEYETQKLNVKLQEPLTANVRFILQFIYEGTIRHGTAGLFYANYLDENNKERTILLTQAQRIDARTIFPCFDEPDLKALFRLSLNRPKEFISVFNTPLVDSKLDSTDASRYWDTFDWSPPMSTYLVAFMVSEYTKRGDKDLALLSRPEFYNNTEFSYNVTKEVIEAYNIYTSLPYRNLGNILFQMASSPKFPLNGMENWGLVLFKDSVLVGEPDYTDGWKDKQYTITIITHETAHMWFGNSVTFAWWSYFWLNEGFARYYQFFLAHKLYPQYQLDQQFVVNQLQMIFGIDATNSTQPLTTNEVLVQTPSQVASKFSSITYAKGAAIVRMFRNLMGHQNFDNAIRNYLSQNQQKNTVPSELFKHFKMFWPSNQQVYLDELFYHWTEQVGYPVLFVKKSEDGQRVKLTQKRFLIESNDGSDPNLKYTIPLTFTSNNQKDFENLLPKTYFSTSDDDLELNIPKPFTWIIFNIQQSNYYRVFYDKVILRDIQNALKEANHSDIHVINRAQIVDDLFNFARAELMDYEEVFEFMEYLAFETEYLPWQAAFTGLQRVAQRLTVSQLKNFNTFILNITTKVYQKLDFQNDKDTILDVYNRNNVISWVCRTGDLNCNQRAQNKLYSFNTSNKKPSVDFRETFYCNAIRFGTFNNYMIVDNWYKNENRSSEKELLVRSLGCTFHFAEYHYARILTDQIPQEYKRLTLKSLYSENAENITPVFQMITRTYRTLSEQLGSWSSTADVIHDISNYFTTKDQQKLLEDFIKQHGSEFGDSLSKLKSAVENVENNLQWAEERLSKLVKYLEKRNSGALFALSLPLLMISVVIGFLGNH